MSKIAMITGASAGIGQACATTFAQNGYNLVLTARRLDRLEKLAETLMADFKVDVRILGMDVRSKQSVVESFESLDAAWQQIDVLINNAGLSQGLDPLDQGDTDDWDRMIDTNIKGLLYVSRMILPGMKERMSGHVINIGSIAGKEVYPNGNVYCATKHAVDALNKSMRMELLPYHIKVTALHPGAANTEFSEVRFKGDVQRASQVYQGYEPLVAADIADAAWYVASRPNHVNINEIIIMPASQASGTMFNKK